VVTSLAFFIHLWFYTSLYMYNSYYAYLKKHPFSLSSLPLKKTNKKTVGVYFVQVLFFLLYLNKQAPLS
jgi:hypothetical protein